MSKIPSKRIATKATSKRRQKLKAALRLAKWEEQANAIIDSLPIHVPRIKLVELRKMAVKKAKKDFRAINFAGEPDLSESDIKREMVDCLMSLSWPELPPTLKVDRYGTIFGRLNDRIYSLIATKYPSLKKHCKQF
jgi:hypothetical protein